MKKIMRFLPPAVCAAFAVLSCKPAAYTGPLDDPCGNWLGVHSTYSFNGEEVAAEDVCGYSVISFYRQGLCCIEGRKGSFPYSYDKETSLLEVGSDRWSVTTLTGTEMVLEFLEEVLPEELPDNPGDGGGEGTDDGSGDGTGGEDIDGNGIVLPAEFKGTVITSDGTKYIYTNKRGEQIRCYFVGAKDETGKTDVRFWFDTHTDRFVPYK